MKTYEIILLYLTFIAIASFGLWQWLSRESDPVEKGFWFMYVIRSGIAIICFSVGVLTGQV